AGESQGWSADRRLAGTVRLGRAVWRRRPRKSQSLQGGDGGGRRGRTLFLPHANSHRRLEARRVRLIPATASTHPLLLAGHRVATYITAECRRLSRRTRQNQWGPTLKLRAKPGAARGPGRSAGKRGCKWRK